MLELVIALAVFGVLATLVVPNFEQFHKIYRLRGATGAVFVELQKARLAAIKDNNRYSFSIADDTHHQIHDDEDSDGDEEEQEIIMTKSMAVDSPGVVLSADNATEGIFLPNGTVSFVGGFTVAFRLTNTSGQWERLVISTGGARILIM